MMMVSGLRQSVLIVAFAIAFYCGPMLAAPVGLSIAGELTAVKQWHDGETSWLGGGIEPFSLNGDGAWLAEGHLQLAYRATRALPRALHARVTLQAQASAPSHSARELGVVEWEVGWRTDLSFEHEVALRAGQFFLPLSMENSQDFWRSPYTLHFSSLNSWIGEEFRPIGLDAQYRFHGDHGTQLTAAVTAFGGNDAMGALLAYRGWSYGRQRIVYGDVVDLPPLAPLADGAPFAGQRDDGTRSFGRDLDGRPGFAARVQYFSDALVWSAAWVDNRGDTELHRGEYAWRTRFGVLGLSWFLHPQFEWLTEVMQGRSKMGAGPGVDIAFFSAYSMGSWTQHRHRVSVRLDWFRSDDRDAVDAENNDRGRSVTLAYGWNTRDTGWRWGLETMYLDTARKRTFADTTQQSIQARWSVAGMLSYIW